MVHKKYKLIISDLGNVLANFDHKIAVRKILSYTAKKEDEIYQLFFDSPLTALFEEGKISPQEFFKSVKELLELRIDYNAFLPIWNDIFFETSLNKKIQDFLQSIKGTYTLIMISNINQIHFEFLKKRMDIFKIFDKLILSCEIGCRKPDPRIYQAALDFAGVDASQAFYIDDRKDLVEAASRLGIKGITFDSEDALQDIAHEIAP